MFPTGIHALPVELLATVFVLGAEDGDPYRLSPFLLRPDEKYYAVPSTLFQLTASHVCHHWRHVALRTPALWTTLCFREQSHIPRAAAYLERCTPSPSRRLDILVDTVAPAEHVPGVTLCRAELTAIFDLICPHVPFWRAFHLKIRDDTCKQIARRYLGNAPPAPSLETLQLYHFEDFRAVQDLYIATYRRPVRIFSNSLPSLRNVSLIGVNLPWDASPYLHRLDTLELALHSDHTRPPYVYWDRMLRFSPYLQRLLLHYSGPRAENGTEDLAWTTHDNSYSDHYDDDSPYQTEAERKRNAKGKAKQVDSYDRLVLLESLWELSLTDLDPDYLCRVLQRLVMPNVNKLSLDLPDQDFTPFVELITPPPPLLHLHEQHECEPVPSVDADAATNHRVGTVPAQEPLVDSDDVRHFASGSASSSSSEEQGCKFSVRRFGSEPSTSTSAQSPTSRTPPSSGVSTTILTSSSSTPSIKSALSSISPSTMSPSALTLRNVNTSSVSVNPLASFGSTSQSHRAVTSSHSGHIPPFPSSSHPSTPVTNVIKPSPLPRLSTTLHTLIITALDCEGSAWTKFFESLEVLQVLEVNFYKVKLLGGGAAYKVLLDRVHVGGGAETRMVMPLLRRCKVAGLSGVVVRRLVEGRVNGQRVDWLVAEDKVSRGDRVLNQVFERGVWVASEYGGRRWVKVQRVVEDEDGDGESDTEEEEIEGGEGEDLDAQGETDVDDEEIEDEPDEEASAGAAPPTTETEAEEHELLTEQYVFYLDSQSTDRKVDSRASSVGGSSTSGSASGYSDSGSSSLSAGSSSSVWKSSLRRSDSHRGME